MAQVCACVYIRQLGIFLGPDRRRDPADLLIERWAGAASISGNTVTFGPNFRIGPQFAAVYGVDPVVNPTYMGDYDQMAADTNFFYTTWGDNRDQSIGDPTRKNENVRFAKFSVSGPGASLDTDSVVVTGGDIGIRCLAINLAQAAGGQQHGFRAQFVQRAIEFIDKPKAHDRSRFHDKFGGKGVCAQMQMWNRVRARQEGAADFASRGVAVRVQDSVAAMRRFSRERELCALAVELRSPVNQLLNAVRPFLH